MPIAPDFLINLVLTALNMGSAAGITYKIMEAQPLQHLSPMARRYLSLALACLIACLLYLLYCWLAGTWPDNARHWANDLVGVSFLAVIGSQTLHGTLNLSPKPKALRPPTKLPF